MTTKSPISPNNKDSGLIDKATIYINKRTVQFGQEVYQFHNITGFGVAPIKTIIPFSLIAFICIVGIVMAAFPSQNQIIQGVGLLAILIAVLCFINNFSPPEKYGLGLYLNSGHLKIFVTSNNKGLKQVVDDLYKYMNNDGVKGTYVVNVVRGNITGNYIGGNAVDNNVNFQ